MPFFEYGLLTMLAFADVLQPQMTTANMLYSTVREIFADAGIAIGVVALRFSDMIDKGGAGQYRLPDFRLTFLMLSAFPFLHLYDYSRLAPDTGDAGRAKRQAR